MTFVIISSNSHDTSATTITMDDVIEIGDGDSEDSVVEIELPRKPSPPLILIEDEDIVLNIVKKEEEPMLAEEFIRKSQLVPANTENGTGTSTGLNSPDHWTLDMIKFYDDDWGDEDQFIVEKLQEKMDKSPFLWDVSIKRFLHMNNKYKKNNVRCWNCNQRGHHFSVCPDPPYVPKCFMCGTQGHLDYCCPNSKCLNCGNPSQEYVNYCFKCRNCLKEVCSRCQLMGHSSVDCPDHWRLFHLTTSSTTVQVPEKNIYKSNKDMWCCNCGKKGHHHTQCLKRKELTEFRGTLPFVISYERAFSNDYDQEKSKESEYKRNKGKRRGGIFAGKPFKISILNKGIRKDKHLKNKLRKIRRNKKKKRKQETGT